MKIRGILFDKDGTLIDFFSLWLQAALEVIPEFLEIHRIYSKDLEEDLLGTIGVKDGRVDPEGGLAYKTYEEIANDIKEILKENRILMNVDVITNDLKELFTKAVTKEELKYTPITDLGLLLDELKNQGIRIGLATADTMESAKSCLHSLDIIDYFDYIGADDGVIKPKPSRDMFERFCTQCQLSNEEVAVVGDTRNDMIFAKQSGGIAIGVLSGVSKKENLEMDADYIIPSIKEIVSILA